MSTSEAPEAPYVAWGPQHQHLVDWWKAHGYVQQERDDPNSNWAICWSTRIGYDYACLEFNPWHQVEGDTRVGAIIGYHASGTNPRLPIGTCETLEEVQQVHDLVRRLNGYKEPEPERGPAEPYRRA